MAIPLLIGAVALAAGAFGAKKGYDAKKNYDKANDVVNQAHRDYESATSKLEKQKDKTSGQLQALGELRLTTDAVLIKKFVQTIKQVNNVSHKPIQVGSIQIQGKSPDLQYIEVSSYQAADVLKDGVTAVASGVLTGVGASGLATSIGVASTGTAISTLSGAAATNATLAWLGGGSLAAGGMGVAGGTAVLGGAIAGPVIAVMGYSAAKKSERALTQAYEHESEIAVAIEQIKNGISVLKSIAKRTTEIYDATQALGARLDETLGKAEIMISGKAHASRRLQGEKREKEAEYKSRNVFIRIWNWVFRKTPNFSFKDPLSYDNFAKDEQQLYMITVNLGYALHSLLKVRVLDESGDITHESAEIIEATQNLIGS